MLRFLLFTVLPKLGNKLLQDATIEVEFGNWALGIGDWASGIGKGKKFNS